MQQVGKLPSVNFQKINVDEKLCIALLVQRG